MKNLAIALVATIALAGAALASDSAKVEEKTAPTVKLEKKTGSENAAMQKEKITEPEIMTTELGVRYQDLIVGEGKECKIGSRVDCHYTLWFADSTGTTTKRFQSSKDGDQSFQCTLGTRLIKGWSDGMVGMKEGGTRRLIISPELGYGEGGGPIPANQWLVFEIDFLKLVQ